jgi:hypothetical protein
MKICGDEPLTPVVFGTLYGNCWTGVENGTPTVAGAAGDPVGVLGACTFPVGEFVSVVPVVPDVVGAATAARPGKN